MHHKSLFIDILYKRIVPILLKNRKEDRLDETLVRFFPTYCTLLREVIDWILMVFHLPFALAPQLLIIEPTNRCNLSCKYCYASRKQIGDMDYDLFRQTINYNPQLRGVILSWRGEPFLNPSIFEMINYTASKNIYCCIYTNGTLLNKMIIDKIFSSGLDELNISLDGLDDVYYGIRGVDYKIVENNIEFLLEEKERRNAPLRIGLNVIINADTLRQKDEIKRRWRHKVDKINYEPIMGEKAQKRQKVCNMLWHRVVVSYDGVLNLCCVDMLESLKVGNINEKSLWKVYNSKEMRKIRRAHLKKEFPMICKYCSSYFG